jgi:dipeptidyl aminopeptidase/acylaminoacyl peptidase
MASTRKSWRWLIGLVLLSLLLVAPIGSAQERAKRPMTFMDVVEMRSVGSPSISPDGRWAIYTISIPEWKAGKNFSHIFVAPMDGSSPPRQMTFTKEKNETQPQWARDSRSFGFLSDRDATGTATTNQLYLMTIDGGEVRKVSDAKGGVDAFAFSRDGRWLAFSAGKADERQLWLLNLGSDHGTPVQLTRHATPVVGPWAWSADSTRIFFIAPDSVDKVDEQRKMKGFDVRIVDQEKPPAHLWSIEIADKSERRWTSGSAYGVWQFTISPNSRYLAFQTASTDRHANPVTQDESEIYLLDLETRTGQRVTENHVAEDLPFFSPDSQWLEFRAPYFPRWNTNAKLYVYPVAGGPIHNLLADWDYSVFSVPTWSGDSKALYFVGTIGVNRHFFSASVPQGKVTQLTNENGVLNGRFDHETQQFLFAFTNPNQPYDSYAARPETIGDRARWVRLSDANPQVAGFQLGEYETIHWKSTDGQMIEGILIKPVGYKPGKRYPLIAQVSGGLSSAALNVFSGWTGAYANIFAANGYALFWANYRGTDGYGEKFHTQIVGNFFRQGYEDIMAGVDYLIARGIADPDKLGMMGWSIGGGMSNWTLTHTDRFKAISTGAGHAEWISAYAEAFVQQPYEFYHKGKPWENWDGYVAQSPLRYIQNAKTPTLIHVGEFDQYGMKPQTDELHMALKKLGVPTEYIIYPGMPHGITSMRYQMVKMVAEFNWFEKWLKGKPGWLEWQTLLDTLEEPAKAESSKKTEAKPN